MAWALFSGRALLAARCERRLDTERELRGALENRLLLLSFGAARCPRCRRFEPRLRRFWSRLTEPAHVERPEQLGLVYVGQESSREELRQFLRSAPRRWMAVPYGDSLGRELAQRFGVSELPAVVVLDPSGAVLVGNAVREIRELGAACFHNWRQAAELLERNFCPAEDSDGSAPRSLTEPLRRLKYRVWSREEEGGGGGGGGGEEEKEEEGEEEEEEEE